MKVEMHQSFHLGENSDMSVGFLGVPGTSFHGASLPDSPWLSGSGHARSHRRAFPDSGPPHQGSWVWPWALKQFRGRRRNPGG